MSISESIVKVYILLQSWLICRNVTVLTFRLWPKHLPECCSCSKLFTRAAYWQCWLTGYCKLPHSLWYAVPCTV